MTPESQHIPQIHSQQSFPPQSPPPVSNNGFPILAIAAIGITATAFLLVSYYIFIAKCCFRWRLTDPLSRFLIRRARITEDPLTSTSPTWQSRGLSELLIRELPTFQYKKQEVGESGTLSKCMICLLEFQDHDVLRLLPKCSHAFHLDCVDVWLQSNSNCPLCRSTISGRNRYRNDRITALNSSPQDPQGQSSIVGGEDDNFVEIALSDEDRGERGDSSRKLEQKIGKGKQGKFRHVSVMGDEGIDVREKDEQFCIQPTIRSFSMDTAADRRVYLSAREIVRQNRQLREVMDGEERGSRSRRLFSSFGHGRGSRNAILPY